MDFNSAAYTVFSLRWIDGLDGGCDERKKILRGDETDYVCFASTLSLVNSALTSHPFCCQIRLF